MFSVARLIRAGYILGLTLASFFLLRPNMSSGQFPGRRMGMGVGGGMMGMGGGMMGMGGGMGGGSASPFQLQSQLMAEFGAIPVNGMMGMGGGMMGLGGGMMGMGGGMMGVGGGMMGMGSMNMGGGFMTGFAGGMGGNNPTLLQLQLQAEFGAIPVNGLGGGGMMGIGGGNGMRMGMGGSGMAGFAGKNMGGFNGRHGL